MVLNGKDSDKRCTTVSGKAVISSCGGKFAFPINSLLDVAQNMPCPEQNLIVFFFQLTRHCTSVRTGHHSNIKTIFPSPFQKK